MNVALHKIRQLEIFVTTEKAAIMVNKSVRWVQANKHMFVFKRKNGKRNLCFELTSVMEVWNRLEQKKQDEKTVL